MSNESTKEVVKIGLAGWLGIYGAILSTINLVFYIISNKHKKLKYTVVSPAPSGMSILLYNRMNKPMHVEGIEVDVRDNERYLMYGRIDITNKEATIIEHEEGITVKWHGVIKINPNSYEHLVLYWGGSSYRYARKPKYYEKKERYIRITTVEGKKYKI